MVRRSQRMPTRTDPTRGASVHVFTFKEGLLSAVAHDLEIAIERFSITWDDEKTKVDATFDAKSARVLHPMAHGQPAPGGLSARDLTKIAGTIETDVLRARSFPEIRFRSTSIAPEGEGFVVRGTLTLVGQEREIEAHVKREGDAWTTEVVLDQTRWGITPYSAMMGTLKIKPELRVRLRVPA